MPNEDIFETKPKQGILSSQAVVPPPPEAPANRPIDQGLANGELKIDESGAFFTPGNTLSAGQSGMGAENTVAGQMTGLLSSESPYRKAAEASAQRQANDRGLLNSSLAATAGTKAAIESALPIAQQDAGYFQQRGLQEQQGNIQKGLYETQGDISKQLATAGFAHEKELAAAGYTHEKATQEADLAWKNADLASRMDLEFTRMDDEKKAQFDVTTRQAMEDYTKQYIAILADPAFSTEGDRKVAINTLIESTGHRLQIAADIAGVELIWKPEVPTPPTNPTEEEAISPKLDFSLTKPRFDGGGP